MQQKSKERLSLQERTYRALGDIAKSEARYGEINDDIVMQAILEWTTDDVVREGDDLIFSSTPNDLNALFSYVVNHIKSQQLAEMQMAQAEEMIERINTAVDPSKLNQQDPAEWQKLFSLLSGDEGHQEETLDIPDTLDEWLGELGNGTVEELLAAVGTDAPIEGTASEVADKALLDRVNHQAQAGEILAFYLSNFVAGNGEVAHNMIDQYGCGITHSVTSLLVNWIATRQVLPDHMSINDWMAEVQKNAQKVKTMTDEEKIELAREMLTHGDDD